jgi:hypothetical protein
MFPIHTVKKQGLEKFRIFHHLRTINGALEEEEKSFKMEHFLRMEKLLSRGMWVEKLDISSAYAHVPIQEESRKYLGFKIEGKNYRFRTLPFGLSIAPRIFTKILNQMLKNWSNQNILIIGYIDDILIIGKEKKEVELNVDTVKKDLISLGWIIKDQKCILTPVQNLKFLGIEINLNQGYYQIPSDKMKTIITRINSLLKMTPRKVPLKLIASIKGKIIAASIIDKQLKRIVYTLDQLITITLERKRKKWDSKVRLNTESVKVLIQLKELIMKVPKMEFYLHRKIINLSTDASLVGYGGYLDQGKIIIGK